MLRRRLNSKAAAMRGVTMVELLVGLTIGSMIIVGAVFVYSKSRSTYNMNETQARLQEYGRYALSVIEPDVQLAGYYGFSNNPLDFRLRYGTTDVPITQLEQTDAKYTLPAALSVVHDCGDNFLLDLMTSVQGDQNDYTLACEPHGGPGSAVDGADTLTIRRASTVSVPVATDRIQLYANGLKRANQFIFRAADATYSPGVIDDNHEVRNLIVRTYYVAKESESIPGLPALRRKYLGAEAGAPAILDEEILPGVEDLQVEFGIDTGDHDGVAGIDVDDDGNGIPDNPNGLISRYVSPDDPALLPPSAANPDGRRAQVVAVRVWLRIRAEQTEPGFIDSREYKYAGVTYRPAGDEARVRRALVSRTIYLRNARSL